MQTVFHWIMNELKTVPITLGVLILLSYVVYGLTQDHVGIAQFTDMAKQISGVQFTLRHDHLDSLQHAVETELFNLSQHVLDEKAKNHDVDPLYVRRIEELTRQDDELKHDITLIEQKQ